MIDAFTIVALFGLIASYPAIYIVSMLSGFSGHTRMQYGLDFRGKRGSIYDEKRSSLDILD
ncbi:MAG: hypothetical protein JRN15_04180 [Nitrososphaerota archaeon]|nr:hypothetical protein [Nitrososphaerota archaeon]